MVIKTVRERIEDNEPILLFRGRDNGKTIELTKEGRYIHAVKKDDKARVSYSFDLSNSEFIRHEKNKDDKIVEAGNITSWFYGNDIITYDYKFGLLILYNKYHRDFHKYRSVSRFIKALAQDGCMNFEKWVAIGVNFEETETIMNMVNDGRYVSTYYEREFSYKIYKAPSEVDKETIKVVKNMEKISVHNLNDIIENYSVKKQQILNKLLSYRNQNEYEDIFLVPASVWNRTHELVDILTDDNKRYDRRKLLHLIEKYNLNLERFIPYLKQIKNYEHTDLEWVLDNYADYLEAELFLRDGKLRKVNKYPSNLVQMHHNRTSVIKDIEREKARLKDEAEKAREHKIYESYQHLTDINKRSEFSMIVPQCADDVIDEGNRMGHCVGGYIGSIRKEKTFILFMRKTEKLDLPFITVELCDGKICTALGRHNRRLEPDEKLWLEKYADKHNLMYTAYNRVEEVRV